MSLLTGLGLGRAVEHTVLKNANVTTTGADSVNSDELDISQYEGDLILVVSAQASGSGTMALTVEESNTTGTGFDDVLADALVDNLGDNATFDDVAATASDQVLVLKTSLCKKLIRVVMTGTDLDQNVAIVAAAQKKYTDR